MIIVNSLSGGKTSSYIAANYEADHNVFSLVRIEDQESKFKDEKIRLLVEDKIQAPFIATAEDDTIIYTMLDLEQKIGKKINWVTGITFDEVVEKGGGWLPNKLHRYCTSYLKIEPIFHWWYKNIKKPVLMNIGYRANEMRRANTMLKKVNDEGLLEIKATVRKRKDGRNKWEYFAWQKPNFPLIEDGIFKDHIEKYWDGQSVRFAQLNNCVGCFHRNPILLKKMFEQHPTKMDWFASKEGGKNGFWRSDISYAKIKKHRLQIEIDFNEFSSCDTGYCEL